MKNTEFRLVSGLLGSGKLAFTTDVTGRLLGTGSEWGWHRFPKKEGYVLVQNLPDYSQLNGHFC